MLRTGEKLQFIKHVLQMFVISIVLLNGGCATENEEVQKQDGEQEENRFEFLRNDEIKPILKDREAQEQEQVDLGTFKEGELTTEKLKELEKRTSVHPDRAGSAQFPAPFYEELVMLDGDDRLDVSLIFNSAPLLDVIPAFADILDFNFIADSDLKSVITINLNSNMSRRDLWNTFDKMLYLSGAGVVVNDSLLRILPLSKLASQPDLTVSENGETEVCYYPLKNATAKDVVTQIKPFLGKDSVCVELTRPNAIIISDDRANIPKVYQLLDIIDRSGKGEWPRAIIRCKNILPSKITDELKNVLPVLGFYVLTTGDTTTAQQPGSIQLSAIDRLQIVVASAATQEAITEIRNWVEILDSSDSLDQERVFVYKVMNGRADHLIRVISSIYNAEASTIVVNTSTGETRVESVGTLTTGTTARTTATNNRQNNPNVNTVTTTDTDQMSNIFSSEVRIFADGVLNRLIVRTTPRTYASIKALLDRLDIVPAQVLLQVLLVEVTLSESTKFGLELSGAGTWMGDDFTTGTSFSNLNPDLETIGNTKEDGYSFLLADPNNPQNKFGYIRALAGNGMVKVISSPQVLVSSHTEANLSVGEKVPYVASALTDTSSSSETGTTYNSQVAYEETGVNLTITPQITSTDMISLDVIQKLSTYKVNTLTKVDAPIFPSRIIQTKMTIQNGRTMVIGGLIQEKKTDNLDSLPLINNIPILRRFFGSTDASVERTEILVLITGYIVDEQSKVEEMIKRYNDAIRTLNEFDYSLGDRPGAHEKETFYDKSIIRGKPQ